MTRRRSQPPPLRIRSRVPEPYHCRVSTRRPCVLWRSRASPMGQRGFRFLGLHNLHLGFEGHLAGPAVLTKPYSHNFGGATRRCWSCCSSKQCHRHSPATQAHRRLGSSEAAYLSLTLIVPGPTIHHALCRLQTPVTFGARRCRYPGPIVDCRGCCGLRNRRRR